MFSVNFLSIFALSSYLLVVYGNPFAFPNPVSSAAGQGETIGQLLFESFPPNDTSNYTNANNKRDAGPTYFLGGESIYTAFTDSTTGNGYNISIPTNTCANAVLGEFVSPSGEVIQNATLGDIVRGLRSNAQYPGHLKNYTQTNAQAVVNDLKNLTSLDICEPADQPDYYGRELLASNFEAGKGLWIAILVASAVGFGVAFPVLDQTFNAVNETYISLRTEALIIALLGAFEVILTTVVLHLDREALFGYMELGIINFFIWIGAKAAKWWRATRGGVCTTWDAVKQGFTTLRERPPAGGVRGLFSFSPSSQNLIGMGQNDDRSTGGAGAGSGGLEQVGSGSVVGGSSGSLDTIGEITSEMVNQC